MPKDEIRERLIIDNVMYLQKLGHPGCNRDNIFYDEYYKTKFRKRLREKYSSLRYLPPTEYVGKARAVITELLNQLLESRGALH